MRIGRRVAAAVLACFAIAAPAAQASGNVAGKLDPSFGEGGKAMVAFPAEDAGATGPRYELPFEFTPGHLQMAPAPGHKLVVAGAGKIVRFLGDGKLDRSFGGKGYVTVPRPAGEVFVLASATVDSKGRILLAGLSRPLPRNSTPDPVTSSAVVMRFTAAGSLDQSFADGGMLVGNLGFAPPRTAAGTYPGPSIGLRDIVVDAEDRPLVTGGHVTDVGGCNVRVDSTGFVARLTEGGALDPSFGEGGLRTIGGVATLGLLAPFSADYVTVASTDPHCAGREGPANLLTAIDANGDLDPAFGAFGFRSVGFPEAPALAIAPSGKILLLGRPHGIRIGKKRRRAQTVERLLPSGAGDPGFGRVGSINYTLPNTGQFSAVAVDPQERVLLAGLIKKRLVLSPTNRLQRSSFLLLRTKADGFRDPRFGIKGSVTTGFGPHADAFATQVMVEGDGTILVGGGVTTPELKSGGGFALARYIGKP